MARGPHPAHWPLQQERISQIMSRFISKHSISRAGCCHTHHYVSLCISRWGGSTDGGSIASKPTQEIAIFVIFTEISKIKTQKWSYFENADVTDLQNERLEGSGNHSQLCTRCLCRMTEWCHSSRHCSYVFMYALGSGLASLLKCPEPKSFLTLHIETT